MENPYCSCMLTSPTENPYCSCMLTTSGGQAGGRTGDAVETTLALLSMHPLAHPLLACKFFRSKRHHPTTAAPAPYGFAAARRVLCAQLEPLFVRAGGELTVEPGESWMANLMLAFEAAGLLIFISEFP